MLVLNKSLSTSYIYPTVTPELIYSGNIFYLVAIEKYTNKKHEMLLGQNYSTFTSRYDMFRINAEQIVSWAVGDYEYTIWEYNGDANELVTELEKGILKVVSAEPEAYRTMDEYDQQTEEFIVYQGI